MTVTIENLDTASAQDVFDTIANHLLAQGQKSLSGLTSHRYRVEKDGKVLRCAAGVLIPDSLYRPEFEDLVWADVVGDYHISAAHRDLIGDLQDLHDSWEVERWKEGLNRIAAQYKLTPIS